MRMANACMWACATLAWCGLPASAQEPASLAAGSASDAIVVLDASGSMWGRIDETEKIVIAREVISQLLNDLPAERRLGLVAYGHNREGDCTDIEEIAAVGAARADIRAAVQGLNPVGKTPLSDAVRFAAERLGYADARATVILVSDGKETCDVDPCATAAELERLGVDFTTHVIGFDITEEQDRAQLQCLAENTGGRYINAADADELADALERTVVEIPEPPAETGLILRATELPGGPLVEAGLTWRVVQAGGGQTAFEETDAGETAAVLAPGSYDVFVERPQDGQTAEARNVALNPGAEKTVTLAFDLSFDARVSLAPEDEAPAGSEVTVFWSGPERRGDYVTLTTPDAPQNAFTDYAYVRDGNPLTLRLSPEPGDYEVRYVLGQPPRVLARAPITSTPVGATLVGPQTVAAGADFELAWTGPGYDGDWMTIIAPDALERSFADYAYPREGSPVTLRAPLEPGAYELRYVLAGRSVIAREPIEVTAVEAAVSGPSTAMAGTRHPVEWTGPGTDGDWLTVVAPDAPENRYQDYAYTRAGSPLELRMPLEPGDYEIRYVQRGRTVIARQPVTVTPAEASLEAPDAAAVGDTLQIAWTGPGERGDWITIVPPDMAENRYTDYAYTRDGSPLEVAVPLEPGDYEVRYVLNGRKVVARRPLTVADAPASLAAPDQVAAGAEFEVVWEGPAHQRDFVTIVAPDAAENRFLSYRYTRDGGPVRLTAPAEAGSYELRYVLGGRRVIARNPIEVAAE